MILTDSTADLSPEYLIKEEVQSIPLFIRFEDEVYRDGVDITAQELYQRVSKSNEVARSTGLRSGDFHNAFNKYIKRGYDILYLGIGSNLSSTIQSALIAKQELETKRVFIVDSKTVSAGLGLLVNQAVLLRNQGLHASEIKTRIDELIPRLQFFYMISDLELLGKTSRIKSLSLKFARMMKSKPVVSMINDRIEKVTSFMGPFEKKLIDFARMIEKKTKNYEINELYITHSCDQRVADIGKKVFQEHLKPNLMITNPIGCVLGAQVGENTLGVAYLLLDSKKRDQHDKKHY